MRQIPVMNSTGIIVGLAITAVALIAVLVGCSGPGPTAAADTPPPIPLSADLHWVDVTVENGTVYTVEGVLTEVQLQPQKDDTYELTGIGFTHEGLLHFMRIPARVVRIQVRMLCGDDPPTGEEGTDG